MPNLYDKVMDFISSILFKVHNGRTINILIMNWDHLIVLDACRCDIFKLVYTAKFSDDPNITTFTCVESPASSTMEFIKRNIKENLDIIKEILRDVIFINANPVIDKELKEDLPKIFYRYIPVWKNHWDKNLGTVRPADTYRATLKAYLRHPDKRTLTWFMQPHYPYINKRYYHISRFSKEFMNKAIHPNNYHNINTLTIASIIKNIIKKGYLCAGIPPEVCEYMAKALPEVIKAYTLNLLSAITYAKKLSQTLRGTIAITADHGEAFGERLKPFIPLSVYGHPSRIHIQSLSQVPYLIKENKISRSESIKKTLKGLAQQLTNRRILNRTYYRTY